MNKNIKLAVAGAILATASVAQAGIVIPAGEWTVDINGNVNTFATWTRFTGAAKGTGDLLTDNGALGNDRNRQKTQSNMTTGLLPNYLAVTGTTRQNDLDVSFTISINPGSSTVDAGMQNGSFTGIRNSNQENRQAFLTFGDKSWGSVKVGKDLGIFASDAILNDMTLLGVGSGAGSLAGNTTTLGKIGNGFIYADWKSQIAYTTPNFNGFQATVGLTQAWDALDVNKAGAITSGRAGAGFAYEGKASYAFAANDVNGKIWVSGIAQALKDIDAGSYFRNDTAYAGDIGATVNAAGFGLTGYYYAGEGIGSTLQFVGGFDGVGKKRDSNGGYVQATYVLPTKTKVGLSWGQSNLEGTGSDAWASDVSSEMWTAGLYHPLTKHLNLVAEYSAQEITSDADARGHAYTGSLGAILFF
jgi:predicted porin